MSVAVTLPTSLHTPSSVPEEGCWEVSGNQACEKSQCIADKKPSKVLNNTKFCCCAGDLCNTNVTDMYVPLDAQVVPPATEFLESRNEWSILYIALACTLVPGFLFVVAIVTYWSYYNGGFGKEKPSPDTVHLMENGGGGLLLGSYTLEHLKLSVIVGQGRYGSVWKGSIQDQEVAVKIFPGHYRSYFNNERDLYCLPFIENPSLLTYYGCDERVGVEGCVEYLLVLSYAPNGCLQDYLRSNVLNWSTFCKMSLTVAKGLAHLHTDIRKGDNFLAHSSPPSLQPPVPGSSSCLPLPFRASSSHLTSSDLLYPILQGSLLHSLSFLTLSILVPPSLYPALILYPHYSDKMKPCVSHRDLNTRNILVKADLSCCLCDLGFAMKISGSKYYYNGEEQHAETKSINDVGTLRYMAPEVLEGAVNLRDCESSLKQIDVYALGLVLWELASRCSDLYHQGAETPPYRLPFEAEVGHHPSFEQMQVMVSRHKSRPLFPELWKDWTAVRLVRETIEDCWDQDAEARLTALCVEERLQELPVLWERQRATIYASGVSPTVNPTFVSTTQMQTVPSIRTNVNNNNTLIDSNREDTDKNSNRTAISNGYNYPLGASITSCQQQQRGPLQPYQGRNPCMERNLMTQAPSDEELLCNGNTLVDRSFKHTSTGHYLSNTNAFESQSLVSHDFLGMSQHTTSSLRPATPIPYVQNAVYDSSFVYATIPKQPNIPGNGSASTFTDGTRKSASRWGGWGKGSGGWGGLKKLLDSKRLLFGMYTSKDEDVRNVLCRNIGGGSKDVVQQEVDEAKSNLLVRQNGVGLFSSIKKSPMIMETQVCLLPTGKAAEKKNGVVTSVMTLNENSIECENNILSVKQNDINEEENNEDLAKISKNRRPSTLPLVLVKPNNIATSVRASRIILDEQFQQVFGSKNEMNASRLKDPNSRVKTPGDVPPSVRKNRGKGNSAARFSLYDDRMMGLGADSKSPINSHNGGGHCLSSSVPSDIDISSNRAVNCDCTNSVTEMSVQDEDALSF
uniref:receptor protein serine/threonine kinase n=1 Tax=Timema bartmani TaxID=61472 RepID=A0A7R9ERI4_9NEOP|nr:unnamed protein product [Timema bartmani]